jgi:hypothetical protein
MFTQPGQTPKGKAPKATHTYPLASPDAY